MPQSARGDADGARPRIGKFALTGPNPINWRVRGRATFAPPRADWDTSRRYRYLQEHGRTLIQLARAVGGVPATGATSMRSRLSREVEIFARYLRCRVAPYVRIQLATRATRLL